MSLHDKQRSSLVTLKGQGAPDAISLTPGQEVAQIEAELRTLGLRRGHKCPFCRLLVPDKLRWKTQGGKQDCPLMYRGNCPGAKTGVNALGRRLRHLREAAEAEGVAEAVAEGLVSAYQGAPTRRSPRRSSGAPRRRRRRWRMRGRSAAPAWLLGSGAASLCSGPTTGTCRWATGTRSATVRSTARWRNARGPRRFWRARRSRHRRRRQSRCSGRTTAASRA